MATKDEDQSVVEDERQVLRTLCQGELDRSARLNTLRGYCWRESLHQVIFDLLMIMPGADAKLLREQLPARLTTRGFPDFDISWFQPITLANEDVERLIERLRVTAATRFESQSKVEG